MAETFPETLIGAIRYFSDEAICRDFVAALRWPNGVVCQRCEATTIGFIGSRSLWRCKACKYEFTVKKGAIFEDSPIPLTKWLPALWTVWLSGPIVSAARRQQPRLEGL